MARLSDYFPISIAERLYTPAMMRYDGTTGTYSRTYTSAGNKVTTVARFTCDSFTGGASRQLFNTYGDVASTKRRHQFAVISNDHATTTRRGRVYVGVNNSVGGQILQLVSKDRFDDGLPHTVFCSYDGDNGTTVFIVDGKDQLDTGNPEHILTTGTMSTGASSNIHMATVAAGGARWANDIGYFGHADAYLTNWQDFMDSHGHLKEISTSSWNGWGSQPLFWNPAGDMANNLGSAGDLNKIGTIEIASGVTYDTRDPQYRPGRMEYDGTSGYYQKTGVTTSGNDVTVVCSFKCASFTGGGIQRLFQIEGSSPGGDLRAAAIMYSSDNADTDRAGRILVQSQNTAGTNIARLISTSGFIDGQLHTLLYSFDGDAGAATFIIDGADVDDTGNADRIAPTTGTLDTGSTGILTIGNDTTNYFKGDIGYFGWRDAYLTNWSDFMLSDGTPKPLDESGWAEWGAQPLFWNAHGDLVNNKGSAGAMTKNGTINVSDGAYRVRRLEPAYTPGMMEFDGSTGYYSYSSGTATGNKCTAVMRFQIPSFTGDKYIYLGAFNGNGNFQQRLSVFGFSSDYSADATRAGKLQVFSENSAGTAICKLISTAAVMDGQVHTLMYAFDGDAGTAFFYIDGVDADDTGHTARVAPTTGTLGTTAFAASIGAYTSGVNPTAGSIGFVGYRDAYLTNWGDFMEADGTPKQLNEITWPEWGAQPLFWNPHGDMTNNRGLLVDMTKNGTIDVSDGAYAETELVLDYRPAMMEYDGSTGYYSSTSYTTAGNKCTVVMRFKYVQSAGSSWEWLFSMQGPTNHPRIYVVVGGSNTTSDEQDRVWITADNSAGTIIGRIYTPAALFCDGGVHSLMAEIDGDAGTMKLVIDGVEWDDTGNASRIVPTTGTLDTGGSSDVGVASTDTGGTKTACEIGFLGYIDAGGLSWSDFFYPDGRPKAQDEIVWANSGFGAQPLLWNEHGEMDNNKGSGANLTRNGTIVVGKGGN